VFLISDWQKSVRRKQFVLAVYQFWKGISAGPALEYFTWFIGAGGEVGRDTLCEQWRWRWTGWRLALSGVVEGLLRRPKDFYNLQCDHVHSKRVSVECNFPVRFSSFWHLSWFSTGHLYYFSWHVQENSHIFHVLFRIIIGWSITGSLANFV